LADTAISALPETDIANSKTMPAPPHFHPFFANGFPIVLIFGVPDHISQHTVTKGGQTPISRAMNTQKLVV
jgi:hypothetical protein